MAVRVRIGTMVAIIILAAFLGCTTAPVVSITPVQTVTSTPTSSPTTPMLEMTVLLTATPAPDSTCEMDPAATDEQPVDITPGPTPTSGVWFTDGYFGVNGQAAREYYTEHTSANAPADTPMTLDASSPARTIDPANPDVMEAAKVAVKIGDWVYLFDTKRAVLTFDSAYEFPVCRRNARGTVEDLGISGFEIVGAPGYLYVYSNYSTGDFVHWDIFRVSLDGREKRYVGSDFRLTVPPEGEYMYFTGYEYDLYRCDASCEHVERIVVEIPDKEEIELKAQPALQVFDQIEVKGDWLHLGMFAYNFDGGSYSGSYIMKLDGGMAIKTDKGDLTTPMPDAENGDSVQ